MTRTNVDIDDKACAEVMRRYRLKSKREAINYALGFKPRSLAAETASVREARALRGTGWDGRSRSNAFNTHIVILIDTSAWIEFLRNTGSSVCNLVDELIAEDYVAIATCDVVQMEVLAGARDELHLENLRRLLARAALIPTEATDYEDAAALYRRCRGRGETVRKLVDCLIAASAIRTMTRGAGYRFCITMRTSTCWHAIRF